MKHRVKKFLILKKVGDVPGDQTSALLRQGGEGSVPGQGTESPRARRAAQLTSYQRMSGMRWGGRGVGKGTEGKYGPRWWK